jgi:exodeoxyribonuclease X
LVDTETTGLDESAQVIEVAAHYVDGYGHTWSRFSTFVRPTVPIPAFISALTGIIDEDVAGAPEWPDVERALEWFVPANAIVVAHNAEFDARMIAPALYDRRWICTKRLAQHLFPEESEHRLQTLRYSFGGARLDLGGLDPHRAEADVVALRFVLDHILARFQDPGRDSYSTSIDDLIALSESPVVIEKWPFGKYRGQPIVGSDPGYIRWCLREMKDLSPDLRWNLEREVRRTGSEKDRGGPAP